MVSGGNQELATALILLIEAEIHDAGDKHQIGFNDEVHELIQELVPQIDGEKDNGRQPISQVSTPPKKTYLLC